MSNTVRALALAVMALSFGKTSTADGGDSQALLPEAAFRTYAQNYKDLALASCIARAYSEEPKAAADAGATAAGLDAAWTRYDPEKGSGEIARLVDQYLARQYHSIHGPEIRLDLMKCLDLYHSKELETLAERLVVHPGRTYRQDTDTK